MKLKKGLPFGLMFVDDRLLELVEKMRCLSEQDIRELDAFVEYLIHGPAPEPETDSDEKPEPARMYDFMNGGLHKK